MIGDCLRSVASQHGRRLAILDGEQRITFAGLLERVDAAREWLRDAFDPQAGDVFAASIENSWQFVAAFFAVADLGCILTPCNPQLRAPELRSLAARLNFRGAIIAPALLAEWAKLADVIPEERILTVDQMDANIGPVGPSSRATHALDPDAPALYLSTSGSTGAPRLVPRSHRNLVAIAASVAHTLGVTAGQRFLSVVPFHYANGMNNSMLLPLFSGATIAVMSKFTPSTCANLVSAESLDTLIGSPFIYGSLVESVRDPALLASLRRCLSAGARMPSGLVDRWRSRFGITIRQLYGLSEAGVIAIEPADTRVSILQPVQGVEVAILTNDGLRSDSGESGEVAVRSKGLMSGYLAEPELTQERFQDGFFRTGDLGCLDENGNLHVIGRISRLLNIAGVKVDPVEVERAIEMIESVASCHVDTVPNAAGGDVIRARVVTRPGLNVTRREVIEQCRRQLAEYKIPRAIEFVDESAVSLAGKMPHIASAAQGSS